MELPALQDHVVVPVEDPTGHRANISYRANEFVRVVPYAFSYLRWFLYALLVIGSGGVLVIVSVWFPQVFTCVARRRLPLSRLGEAQYMLVLVQEDEHGSSWIELPVHRYTTRLTNATTPPWWRFGYQRNEANDPPKNRKDLDLTKPLASASAPTPTPWVWFEFKKHRYVFNAHKGEFERYLATVKESLDSMRARLDAGLDAATVGDMVELYGANVVAIDPPFVPMLLFTKAVHPYYLFQVFSATVWFCQQYTVYAVVILVLSAVSMSWEIYAEVSNSKRLQELVRSNHPVLVYRTGGGPPVPSDSATKPIDSSKTSASAADEPADPAASKHQPTSIPERKLVPGDIIELTEGPVVADVLLLCGSCVADEASLTGEAVPVNKAPAHGGSETITETEAIMHHKTSFLHAGSTITRIRDASGPCKGVVLSTGFSTGKGELFRSILFPRQLSFEFERDSYRYLAVLATIAIAAFIKRLVNFADQGYGVGYAIVNSLDLVTIAVPPALPLVLSSGVGFALKRLKKRGIFCIDAQRINSCGQLDTFCFDKTGTLTEESMKLVGFDAVVEHQFLQVALSDLSAQVRLAMATCHGISDVDGLHSGSPLDLELFAAANLPRKPPTDEAGGRTRPDSVWTQAADGDYRTLKQFPFDAACQRSGVVIENVQTKQRLVVVKGSPEAISAIAVQTPTEWTTQTLRHSAEGHYCIAFGVRKLVANEDINNRELMEKELVVLGIALFHNELKPESYGMLHELYDAAIDVRMITGDNALTAVHVARLLDMPLKSRVAIVDVNKSSEVVFHCLDDFKSTDPGAWELLTNANVGRVLSEYDLALTGAAIKQLRTDLSDDSIQQLLLNTQIFARIRPTEKAWIVEKLMDYGKIVGMCGDGTNDCGALKAAHVGLALSSAEASIVAPFTSKAKDVTDVPVLIREGRCALTTSFLGFKFMVLYPVIQLGMASTLGHFGTMLSNNQYLWDDLVIVLGLAILMLYTGSSTKLTKERPPRTLFSRVIVASILGQIALYAAFFAGMFALLTHQPWFCHRADGMKLAQAYLDTPLALTSSSSSSPQFTGKVLTNCWFNIDHISGVDKVVDDISVSHEGASVWLFGHMQYFPVALAFNLFDRFRLPMYTNVLYTALFLAVLGINLWFLLDPSGVVDNTFQTLPLTADYRGMMAGLFAAHVVLSIAWEAVATGAVAQWWRLRVPRRNGGLGDKPALVEAASLSALRDEPRSATKPGASEAETAVLVVGKSEEVKPAEPVDLA